MSALAVLIVAVLLGGSAGAAVAYWPAAALVLIAIGVLMILAKLGVDRMPEVEDEKPEAQILKDREALLQNADGRWLRDSGGSYEFRYPNVADRCWACKTAVPFDQCVCGSGFCLDCCACFYAEDLREAEGIQ